MELNLQAVAWVALCTACYFAVRAKAKWPLFVVVLACEAWAVFTSFWFSSPYAPLVAAQAPVVLALLAWALWGRRQDSRP